MQKRTRAATRLATILFGALVAVSLTRAPAVSSAALPDCWDVAYAALHHRAAAAHPQFILYNERSHVTDNGASLLENHESVAYRDDGLARVWDERFGYTPYVTRASDPGPPELGPYGARRSVWMPVPQFTDPSAPLIGQVHTHNPNGLTCTTDGIESYRGHETYRLSFTSSHPERPALKALWIDTGNSEIWKVDLSGSLPIALDDEKTQRLAEFEIELDQISAYVVIDHVTWKYRFREYAQYSDFFGEYDYSGFQFPQTLPSTFFS